MTSTWLHLIISKIFIILHHPYCCFVYTLYNLFAHPCLYYHCLLILQYTVLHILFLFFSYLYLCRFSCAVTYNCTVHGADLTYISPLVIFCMWKNKNLQSREETFTSGHGCIGDTNKVHVARVLLSVKQKCDNISTIYITLENKNSK